MRKFKDVLLEQLKDAKAAQAYLMVALEAYEEDQEADAFLSALRDVAEAHGGLSQLAQRAHLNRQNLYRALSRKGNPKLETVGAVLHGLGFRLSIEPVNKHVSL